MNLDALDRMRQRHLLSDNNACFIERQHILHACKEETMKLPPIQRYAFQLRQLAEGLSTPLSEDDVFAGSMVEGLWDLPEPLQVRSEFLDSQGHLTIDCVSLLQKGLKGILAEVKANSERIGTDESRDFAAQAESCINSIRHYCLRYADAAVAAGKENMAAALRTVPFEPAFDFYSALQSVWMMQFVLSAMVGQRDFAIGRIDRWLIPYCSGYDEEKVELLAFFFMKFNEIKGTATDNHLTKPIPCYASNQYIVLGPDFNCISEMVVAAAEMLHLPQPGINFRLRDDFRLAGRAAHTLDSQGNFFNDKLIYNKLLNSGFEPDVASEYAFTACNRVDIPGVLPNFMEWIDTFCDSPGWFMRAVHEVRDTEDLLPRLKQIAVEEIEKDLQEYLIVHDERPAFHIESLFNHRCVRMCKDIRHGGGNAIRWKHCMFPGIATMADSLNALRYLKNKYTHQEILDILDSNFQGYHQLRMEIINTLPKFGNGIPEADAAASEIANLLIDAMEEACRRKGFIPMVSLYSLHHHKKYGMRLGATPDGRLAGEFISENQSPVTGMDKHGPTALLRSVASLPLERCISGGLNIKFGTRVPAEHLEGLMKAFFQMGGIHIGFTTVDRKTLENAIETPDNYRDLLVRITGFSEYFTSLAPIVQKELLERTEY